MAVAPELRRWVLAGLWASAGSFGCAGPLPETMGQAVVSQAPRALLQRRSVQVRLHVRDGPSWTLTGVLVDGAIPTPHGAQERGRLQLFGEVGSMVADIWYGPEGTVVQLKRTLPEGVFGDGPERRPATRLPASSRHAFAATLQRAMGSIDPDDLGRARRGAEGTWQVRLADPSGLKVWADLDADGRVGGYTFARPGARWSCRRLEDGWVMDFGKARTVELTWSAPEVFTGAPEVLIPEDSP